MKTPSLYSFVLLFLAVMLFSCKPDETDIGSDLIPGEDQLNMFTYEAEVGAQTVREDSLSVFANDVSLSTFLLGSYVDPLFGKVQANFAAEFTPSTSNFTFGTNHVIDSVVLSLEYFTTNTYYGDITKYRGAQRFKVYQLNEDIVSDSLTTYFSNHNVQYKPTLLGEKTTVPNITAGFTWKEDTLSVPEKPQLRITLDKNDIAKNIFQNANPADLASGTAFYNYFKGLYVVADNGYQKSGEGAILRFNADDNFCRIRVFYHNDASTDTNPFDYYDFQVKKTTRKLNIYQHNYKNTQLLQDMLYGGTNANRVYAQAMGGVKTKLTLPNFQQLPEFSDTTATYVINKAELIVPVDNDAYSYFYPLPNGLILYAANTDTTYNNLINPPNKLIRDYLEVSQYFYGGQYNKDKQEYIIRLSLQMSDIINRKIKDKGMYLGVELPSITANRVVISNSPERKIRLRIIYTKI
ncbi:MAG: DUF4270 domain-containing protein [Sphingobacteriales bacterium JAD_PAG50586_3]|nr:MAG: DUF4270 domain-containing protein [Sphingobacteriales bacterium JAD_PAG50586_3]